MAAPQRGVRPPGTGRARPLRFSLLARAARAAAGALPEPVRQSHLAGAVPLLSPVGELQRERALRRHRAAPLRAGVAAPGLARANPARLRLVTSFGLAMLAGFGADAVLDPEEGGAAARRWFLRLAGAVVVAGVLLAAAGNLALPLLVPRLAAWGRHVVEARYAALPAPTHSLDYFCAELDEVLAGMARAFRIGNLAMYAPAAVAVGGWLAVRGSARGPMLVVLAVVELVGLGRGYTPAVPRRDFYPPTAVVSRLARDTTLHRVTALGETLVPDAHMMYGLADVRGLDFPTRWYAAYLDAAGRLPWIAYGTLVGSADSPLLRVLNVKYVVAADERGGVTLAELAHVQPRCFVVHEAVVAESDAQALELLRSAPDAVYSRVVITGPADVPPVAGDGDGEATPIAYAPTETAWSVVTGAGGYLVNTDAYYPGWRAYVDDRPAALYRANVAFRAVLVPAGRHTVTFRYEPRSMRMGVAVSVLAACVCVFLTWRHPPPRNGRPPA
ncbi:MAG: YfhO family protein [Deltaproteobacteria bacterium]|nr:MAG: YfhO family protein [Deltaproteobacteria bacterium]